MALNYSKSFLSTQQEFADGEREEFTPRQGGDAMIPSFFRPLSFIFQGVFFVFYFGSVDVGKEGSGWVV